MDAYILVPVVALGCYIILMLAFLSSQKTVVTRAFMRMLIVYILWTLGSMCMRLGLAPGIRFWFHVSLGGLFLIPCMILFFISSYVGQKHGKAEIAAAVGAAVFLVANYVMNDMFISPPKQEILETGVQYVYDTDWRVALPFLYMCVIMAYTDHILIRYKCSSRIPKMEFVILTAGKSLLILGNLLTVLPVFDGFPIDLFCGILNALLMFFALCRSRQFKLTLAVSRRVYRMLVMTAVFLIIIYMEAPYRRFLRNMEGFSWIQENLSLVMSITFLFVYIVMYWFCEYFAENVFMREQECQAEGLKAFSGAICQSLDLGTVLKIIQDIVMDWMDVEWSGFCLWDEDSGLYRSQKGKDLFDLLPDNPLIVLAKERKGCIEVKKLEQKKDSCSLTQQQLQQLKERGVSLILPVYDWENLYALMFLSGGSKWRVIRQEEKSYLESVASISAVAIRNANMYQKAFREARMDELTRIGNRKYFYEMMKELQNRNLKEPVSLIMMDLDDFKVYNQLYGNEGGDFMLQKLAGLINKEVKGLGQVFRYGATEFSVWLPGKGEDEAYGFAEKIRSLVLDSTQGLRKNQMMVTISCGVSCVGAGQKIDETVVDRCGMAVISAKHNGKNCTVVYHENSHSLNKRTEIFKPGIYNEYAATFQALTAAVDAKDHYTYSHSQNVAYYSMELARIAGLGADSVEIAREAGLLHDIGKIGIPESILKKPGMLTDEEYEVMKTHVEQSIAILRHLPSLEYVMPAVMGHHERYDGQGYPRKLAGKDIPELARILCIADSFDAMVSRRSYKDSYTVEHSLEQLEQCSGSQFDPGFTLLFVSAVRDGRILVRHQEVT